MKVGGSLAKAGIALAVVAALVLVAAYHSSPPIKFDSSLSSEQVLLRPMYVEDTTAQFAWSKPGNSTFGTRYYLELTAFLPEVDYVPVKVNSGLHARGSRQTRFGKLTAETTHKVCLWTGTPLRRPFGEPECVNFITAPLDPDAQQPE